MAGEIIRKGDPTSHGGVVLEGSLTDICMGQPIAYIGHKVQCPQCKGAFPIIEGVLTTTFYGKGVAVAGMKTACGATLVATQFTDTVEWSSGSAGATTAAKAAKALVAAEAASAAASAAGGLSKAASPAKDAAFDEQFALLDDQKQPMPDIPYTVKLQSGAYEQGVTDAEGCTKRYATDGAQPIEVYLGHRQA
ncbi:PAAR domain-containing protein [Massilia sp. TSP1-1-2]|uniref:PAAR domain-containing protein n=1 Tax=Massilia sp. TSP1-1-2 TaxID=2804649 RepID=UPI003CF26E0B